MKFTTLLAILSGISAWSGDVMIQDWQDAQDSDLSVYAETTKLRVISTWRPERCRSLRKVQKGDTVEVKYVVKLTDNTGFTNSVTYRYTTGKGEVVPAWEYGLEGACVGENRRIIAPPDYAYGENAYEPGGSTDDDSTAIRIPPNSVVVFDCQIVSIW